MKKSKVFTRILPAFFIALATAAPLSAWDAADGSAVKTGNPNAGPRTNPATTLLVWSGERKSLQGGVELPTLSEMGIGSFSFGEQSGAHGDYAFASGLFARAGAYGSLAMGVNNTVTGESGEGSATLGRFNVIDYAEGLFPSFALGEGLDVRSAGTFAIGRYNDDQPNGSVDSLFIIGRGAGAFQRADALRVDWHGNLWVAGRITAEGGMVEADPLFSASTAAGIHEADVSAWNHLLVQAPHFLTSEVDGSISNELITDVSLGGNVLKINESGNAVSVDLSSMILDNVDDADADPTNELISDLSLVNEAELQISEGGSVTGSVDLAPLLARVSSLSIPDEGTPAVTVNQAGDVNIGTTTSRLAVPGAVQIDGTLTVGGEIILKRQGDIYMGEFGMGSDVAPSP